VALVDHDRFSLTCSRALGAVVVRVEGDLDAAAAGELQTHLAELIEGQGNLDIILDLSGLTSFDATGVEVFLDALGRLRQRGGELTLSAPSPVVGSLLERTGLNRQLPITRL